LRTAARLYRCCRAEAEVARDGAHGRDHVRDVLVELEAELLCAAINLVAMHAGREGRLLELLPHRLGLERLDPVRPDEPAGVNEPRELVAGEQRLLQLGVSVDRQMLGVREDGVDELLRIALFPQDRRTVLGMLVERRMDLVVEIVEEGGCPPEVLVLTEFPGVPAYRGLDRQCMTPQRLALRKARKRVPCALASCLHPAD
jgi:hypothetical protein